MEIVKKERKCIPGVHGNKMILTCDDGVEYSPDELGEMTGVTGPTICYRIIKYGMGDERVLSGPAKAGRKVGGGKKKSLRGIPGTSWNRGNSEFAALSNKRRDIEAQS